MCYAWRWVPHSPSGTASAPSSFAASDVFIQSRDLRPLDRYFPELHEAPARRPRSRRLRRRRRDRHRDAAGARLRRAAAAAASRGVARREAREGDAGLVRRLRPAALGDDATCAAPQSERRARLERLLAAKSSRRPPHADDARSRGRPRLAGTVRGRRARRRHGQAGDGRLPARQARDDQDQARAHGRLRRRRLPLAQERQGRARRLAAARALRRRRALHHVGVTSSFTMARRGSSVAELEPLREERARRTSLARVGRGAEATTRMPGGQSRWSAARTCRGSRCASSACAR